MGGWCWEAVEFPLGVRAEMDETVRHPDQKMRGIISWGKLLPSLMHASQGGVMSGVILCGVMIEYHIVMQSSSVMQSGFTFELYI